MLSMRQSHHVAMLALTAALAIGAVGCPGLTQACQKALPTLNQSNALVNDASIALESAASVIDNSKLAPDVKLKAQTHIETARMALQAASTAITSASNACYAPDVQTVFRDFMTAWAAIRPFLALLGSTGGTSVQDPMVYRMTVQK